MTEFRLVAARDAASTLAAVFGAEQTCQIQVLEDQCFNDSTPLPFGQIRLREEPHDLVAATSMVAKGGYEWHVPEFEEIQKSLEGTLGIVLAANATDKAKESHRKNVERVSRTLDQLASLAFRLGLTHPTFDPISVEEMCERRGTTVVADTSGVLQGGLDFVARFLHPVARIKVPAVVHMEVIQQSDNFLKQRRSPSKRNPARQLMDHILSQSGQRALLRLELRSDTEIERTPLLGDPLRNAFQTESDQEFSELNMSVPLRGYVDRLVLEATRQHQSYSSPGHRVHLLTADQGLAKMALAEGISPLYFQSTKAQDFFGRKLTGTVFNPFTADLYKVSLESVIWELATAFGTARLISADGTRWAEVAAIGQHLTWSPVHSRNDLLWLRSLGLPDEMEMESVNASEGFEPNTVPETNAPTTHHVHVEAKAKTVKKPSAKPTAAKRPTSGGTGYYKFNIEKLLEFFTAAADEGASLTKQRAESVFASTAPDEYRRFLLAGHFAETIDGGWILGDAGLTVGTAIRQLDYNAILDLFSRVPSVRDFVHFVRSSPLGLPVEAPMPARSRNTYLGLGEILCIVASVADRGYFPTHAKFGLTEFVEVALKRFRDLDTGDGYVSAGAWLEALVVFDGIHPVNARNSLEEASAAKLIRRSTEGSTLDRRHDDHSIQLLRLASGTPKIETLYLYRGDFLIPQKSSSSIQLERAPR